MIKPVGKKFIVETISDNDSNSIILLNPEKTQKGKVLATGEKVNGLIQKGTLVLFPRYAGTEIVEDNKTYLILDEKDVLIYE